MHLLKFKGTIFHKQGLWKNLIHNESIIVIHGMDIEIIPQALLVENMDNK